jgi:hypothetical protein
LPSIEREFGVSAATAAAALPAVRLYRLISLVAVVALGWGVAAVQATRARTALRPASR